MFLIAAAFGTFVVQVFYAAALYDKPYSIPAGNLLQQLNNQH
jgi:hypothetical protein